MRPLAERTAILGTGLIGGSLAAAGRRAGVLKRVIGVGRGRPNLETALAAGLIDEISHDAAAACREADLVVLAAPVDTCLALLREIAPVVRPGCIVTDVGSVKEPVCREAVRLGLGARFVGGHPMAGGVSTGAAVADAELFRERLTVLTPVRETARDALDTVHAMWRAVGARVVEMEPALHDRVVAMASHLPQMLVYCLSAVAGADGEAEWIRTVAGRGFRDTTRLASSDPEMWIAIARLNRDRLLAAMDAFDRLWHELREAVAAGDERRLRSTIERARNFKESLGS